MNSIHQLIKAYVTAYLTTLKSRQYKPLDQQWKARKKELLEQIKSSEQTHLLSVLGALMLYYGTPISAAQLCNLKFDDVILRSDDKLQIKVHSAEQDRYVLVDEESREVLIEYLQHLEVDQSALFLKDDGQPFTSQDIFDLSTQYPNEVLVSELSGFFPIYQQSDYEIIPTPLRINAVSRYSGKGVTIAFLDSGFYPHPDLTMPDNRVLKYVNIPHPDEDDFDDPANNAWHGMQTSVSAVGNGYLSGGLYKSIAYNADVVLVKASDREGRITTEYMIRGLKWILEHHREYNIRIVNISLGEGREQSYLDNALDQMAEALWQAGIVVVSAVGNDGSRFITPPSSAPSVITVGGFDDKNELNQHYYGMYHSSYGPSIDGLMKPELIAPGIWVAAPILPDTEFYRQSELLSYAHKADDQEMLRALKDDFDNVPFEPEALDLEPSQLRREIENWLAQNKIIGVHYQHVDGTSFSAPIVCSIIAQMLEANPHISPRRIKQILCGTTDKIFNIPIEQQGHGLIHPRKCVKEAENDRYRRRLNRPDSPHVDRRKVTFYYRNADAESVAVVGDFTEWEQAPLYMEKIPNSNTWTLEHELPFKGVYTYKFWVNDEFWCDDPECENKQPDGYGGWNTRLNLYLE